MERITDEERSVRHEYLEKLPSVREIQRVNYKLRVINFACCIASAQWIHHSGPERLLIVGFDNILDVAVPTLVQLRCEHLGIKEPPTDIADIIDIIVEHLETVGNFAAKLNTMFGARVAVEYARWYPHQKFERTYGGLVELAACEALVRGRGLLPTFERVEFK